MILKMEVERLFFVMHHSR